MHGSSSGDDQGRRSDDDTCFVFGTRYLAFRDAAFARALDDQDREDRPRSVSPMGLLASRSDWKDGSGAVLQADLGELAHSLDAEAQEGDRVLEVRQFVDEGLRDSSSTQKRSHEPLIWTTWQGEEGWKREQKYRTHVGRCLGLI